MGPQAPITIPERFGPCRVIRPLGEGALGIVVEAEMTEARAGLAAGSRVALKLLRPELGDDAASVGRFLREGVLGQAVRHPAVVRTFGEGSAEVGGRRLHYLLLELIEGRTLRALFAEHRRVPEGLLRLVGAQVAAGLAAIHAVPAVHRDVKPENILITPDHRVKLMDLGLAAADSGAGPSAEEAGRFTGTILYASPEQVRGEPATAASDLYALGVVLYEGATGSNPFAGGGAAAVGRRHREEAPPRAGEANPELSPLFEEVLSDLLAKDPGRRFASAAALAETLERGDRSEWWRGRERALRAAHPRGELRRLRVRRATALIGRERELAALRAGWAAAARGEGGVTWIEGEGGAGKTRLVDELVRELEAAPEPPRILYGAYRAGSAGRSALADAVVGHLGAADLEARLGALLPATPRLVPGLAAILRGEPLPAGCEEVGPEALGNLYGDLALALARDVPLLWVVEDLQFASAAEGALVAALARASVEGGIAVLVTTWPDVEMPSIEPRSVCRLPVGRLARDEMATLLAAAVGDRTLAEELSERLTGRAQGNPLYLLEVIRELRLRGLLVEKADGTLRASGPLADVEVPATVRDVVLLRLQGLAAEERGKLEVAALLGESFDPAVVATVLGLDSLEVQERLAEAERRTRLVRAVRGEYEFDHRQVQETLVDLLPPERRAALHGAIADALLHGSAPEAIDGRALVQVAEHLLRSGRTEAGLALLPRVLEYLDLTYGHEDLHRLIELVLAAPGKREPGLLCDLWLTRAASYDNLGRREEQRHAVETAVAAAEEAGDAIRLGTARMARGRLLLRVGDGEETQDGLVRAVADLKIAGDSDLLAQALELLGTTEMELGRRDRAQANLEEAYRCAQGAGSARTLCSITGTLGALAFERGDPSGALALGRRYLKQAQVVGRSRIIAQAHSDLGRALYDLGRYDEALGHFTLQGRLSEEIGNRPYQRIALTNSGYVELSRGRLGAAREVLEKRVLGGSWRGRFGHEEVGSLIALSSVYREEGRLDDAELTLVRANRHPSASTNRDQAAQIHCAWGHLARAQRDPAKAREEYAAAIDVFRALEAIAGLSEALLGMGRLLLEEGETEPAGLFLQQADRLTRERRFANPGPLPAAYLSLMGAKSGPIRIGVRSPVAVRAESHVVLHRAGRGAQHARVARRLLEQMSSHLPPAGKEQFWANNATARQLGRV